MDPLTIGAVTGIAKGVGSLLSGLIDRKPSEEEVQMDRLYQEQLALGVPPAEALNLVYSQYKSAGKLTPQLENTIMQADSEMKKVATSDPALQAEQRKAIAGLSRMADEGLTLEDRASLEQALSAADQQRAGAEGAIMNNMQARGVAGAGAELAQRQMAADKSADASRNVALETAARAAAARREAILNLRREAGTMEEAQYGRDAGVARSQDAVNQFNTANSQSVQGRNVGRTNDAAAANLDNTQNILNKNTDMSNKAAEAASANAKWAYNAKADKLTNATNMQVQKANVKNNAPGSTIGSTIQAGADLLGTGIGLVNSLGSGSSPLKDDSTWEEEQKLKAGTSNTTKAR